MTIEYLMGSPAVFSQDEKEAFRLLLIEQDKVNNPTIEKVDRCLHLCMAAVRGKIVAIGAIKPKTEADFRADTSGESARSDDFSWELGYCYTQPSYWRRGIGSHIIEKLLERMTGHHLLATTELRADNSMLGLLERAGFLRYGATWKSTRSGEDLALFLRYV